MILILSQDSFETTTDNVIDWLDALGACFLRINGEDLDRNRPIRFLLSGVHLEVLMEIDGTLVDFASVRAVWYRRWTRERRHEAEALLLDGSGSPGLHFQVANHLTNESRRLAHLFFSQFAGLPWLSDPENSSLVKLDTLRRAASIGIDTPATLVTTRRVDLENFADVHGSVITKPLSEVKTLMEGERAHFMYTTALSQREIAALPEEFTPSLFQESLSKAYELRVFYLEGQCYAMAIFSQSDQQTRVDFRFYNTRIPNRVVPYRLSPSMVSRLQNLMDDLNLNTGSIDLIVTPEGRQVFLEVNPIGQFGMVSQPCNYYLERKIAEWLIRKANND